MVWIKCQGLMCVCGFGLSYRTSIRAVCRTYDDRMDTKGQVRGSYGGLQRTNAVSNQGTDAVIRVSQLRTVRNEVCSLHN